MIRNFTILLSISATLAVAQTLDVSPTLLTLTASGAAGETIAPLFVRNIGTGGPLPFTFTGPVTSAGCSNVNTFGYFAVEIKNSHTTNDTSAGLIAHVYAGTNPFNKAAITPGYYRTAFRVGMGGQTQDICLNFLAASSALGFSVSKAGLQFNAQSAAGTAVTQDIPILATGSPSAWIATAISDGDFLNINPSSGTATPGSSKGVSVSVNKVATAGTYYGAILVSPTAPGLTPSAVTVVYTVTANAPPPAIGAGGGVLVASPSATQASINLTLSPSLAPGAPGGQNYVVTTPAPFLSVANASGILSGTTVSQVQINAVVSKAVKGFNRASLTASLPGGIQRIIDVLLVLLPSGAVANVRTEGAGLEAARRDDTTNCSPSQIAVVSSSVAGGFSHTSGSPLVYQARVIDDCANPITDASVSLSFSNGDGTIPALLENAQTGTYTATWTPINPGAAIITVRATSTSTLLSASTTTSGNILAGTGPILVPHGLVNNLYAQVGAAVAPGTVASIFGSGFASAPATPGVLPLPTSLQGTSVTVGGIPAPLFYISGNQINIQVPTELASNATYPVVVTNGKTISVPDRITIADASPGVAAFADGGIIAQHGDYQLIDAAHPAGTGEAIIAYLVGMGATTPAVATGKQAPGAEPFARLKTPVTVTVDGKNADILFAGLSPGGIGLYQVVFSVPKEITAAGSLKVVMSQAGVNANTTTLPVVLGK